MTAWIIIFVAVLGSYLLVKHFVGGLAILYLALVCWLLWRNRHSVSRFAASLQEKVDAFDEAEIPHREPKKTTAPRRKYDPYGVPLPKRDPIFNPRPEKPVLSGAFLKKTMGELKDTSANLPVWFKDSSKKVADLRRLTPKEFEAYAARNSLDLLGPWTVGEYLREQEKLEAVTSDDFVENWKKLVKSGKIAELDKAAPRLSEEWLRKFYQLQPRSVRRVFTEEEFVQDRSDVEYGLGEDERRDKRMLDAVLSGNDYLHSDQYKLERERKERQQKEYQERKEQYKAWEERKDALIEQYQKEDSEVNELAYELRKKGDNKAADELVNEHYRKWNSIS